jgi:hypothetical protein
MAVAKVLPTESRATAIVGAPGLGRVGRSERRDGYGSECPARVTTRLLGGATMLELRFGPRLLGLLLAEEIGELHDDGHWARMIVSGRLTNEWCLDTQMADRIALKGFNDGPLARQMGRMSGTSTTAASLSCETSSRCCCASSSA